MGFNIERFKAARKVNGYTQMMLAEKLHLSRPTITMWETGKNQPTPDMLSQMADLFHCTVDYLLGRSDSPMEVCGSNDLTTEHLESPSVINNPVELELMNLFRGFNERGRDSLLNYARFLNSDPNMKQDGASNTTTA